MPKVNSKKTESKNLTGKKPKSFSKSSLVAMTSASSTSADVGIIFKSGLGQITASLFRLGTLINMQSISSSGNIHFSDVQPGDSVSINGVCSGTADITLSVQSNPVTPEHFDAGIIITGYTIL